MLRAARVAAGALSSFVYGTDSYDQDKLGLGPLMFQNNGGTNDTNWAGPLPISVIRPMEYATAIPGVFPWAMRWSSTVDWIFLFDNATAAATRRVMAATYNRSTGVFSIAGFITITFPTATNHTIRAPRATYDLHTAGTVGVSGTAVTGSGSTWKTDGACVGNRIGFGSTDPTQISTWYEIQAIGSDTSITLTTSAGTISAGTAYVIEDLRLVMANTNATTTNGGLFLVKGLRFETFASGGTAIGAATTVDNIRASYWLADAATVTNTVAFGMGLEAKTAFNSQIAWVLDTVANPVLFKYNIRAALTLASGKDTTTLAFKTGAGGAVTGTTSQANNGRLATAAHGPGSGISCLYFTTTTRIYRTADVSTITTGSTTWLSGGDVMTEVPPGSTSTFAATAGMNSIEYSSVLDKFVVMSSGAAGVRSYVTDYNASGSQMDRIILADYKQNNQSTADSTVTPFPNQIAAAFSAWVEGGMLYLARIGTTAATNQVFAVPLGADWEYVSDTSARLIFPRISCPDNVSFQQAFVQTAQVIPPTGASGKNLGMDTEPVKLQYRTSGISDDSGGWTDLDSSGDMTAVTGASEVQFSALFRIDNTMIPARIHNVGVLWNDSASSGTTLTAKVNDLWQVHGLDDANPLTVSASAREAGGVSQTISGTTTVTVTRS